MTSNGQLATSALVQLRNFVPIQAGAGGLATAEVARQWDLLCTAFEASLGKVLYASEGYRDLARQEKLYDIYLAGGTLASVPRYSNHGWALAIDVASGVGTKSGPEFAWMSNHAPDYGFVADVSSEGWHWHYAKTPLITTPTAPVIPEWTDMDSLRLVQTKYKNITDTWLVNIATFEYVHMETQTQINFYLNLKVVAVSGVQPSQVLSNFTPKSGPKVR